MVTGMDIGTSSDTTIVEKEDPTNTEVEKQDPGITTENTDTITTADSKDPLAKRINLLRKIRLMQM